MKKSLMIGTSDFKKIIDNNGYYDDAIEFMRGFLGGALKDNVYIEKAIITDILRVAIELLGKCKTKVLMRLVN